MPVPWLPTDAGNPLLAGIPQEMSFEEWFEAMHFDPRDKWPRPFPALPESYAYDVKDRFFPTAIAIDFARRLHTMMVVSLRARDPRKAENRRRIFQVAQQKASSLGPDLKRMPWFTNGAGGALAVGPTGCQKSHTITAFLRNVPDVLEHGPREDCGWLSLKQLPYLRCSMPADARRGGLLYGMATEADARLGTSWADVILKRKKVEDKLVDALQMLMTHRCGMLILEEVQERNVAPAVLGPEFATFFLRVLNCGIPLVLVGNPLAFQEILKFSQDARRLSAYGKYEFMPSLSSADEEWTEDLVPAIWNWSIFNRPDEHIDGIANLLFERTGGIPDVLAIYRRETLLQALRTGSDQVRREHVDAAYSSPVMKEFHGLAKGYSTRNIKLLSQFTDQPLAFIGRKWADFDAQLKVDSARRSAATTSSNEVPA